MIRHLVSTHGGAALAAAVALALAVPAEAQNRGGGRGFGGWSGGNWSGGMYPGGQYGGYFPGQYGYGGMQPGYGYPGSYGNYGGGYYQPGTVYGYSGYSQPYQQYGMPQSGYVQQYPMVQDSGVVQAGYQSMGQPMGMGNTARLTVKVPANAQLSVQNQPMQQQSGPVRVMNSPPLQPGQTYHYTLKAQWDDNGHQTTQERAVNIQAGSDVTVDFTQPEQQQGTPQTNPAPGAAPSRPS
jgi:uncharacterized protein (TIGR03000 family)